VPHCALPTHLLECKVVAGVRVIQQLVFPQDHPPHLCIVGQGDAHDALLLRGQDGDGVLLGALLVVRVRLPVKQLLPKGTLVHGLSTLWVWGERVGVWDDVGEQRGAANKITHG